MAANTKYQPVAARDSFEEGERSMPPPPSYQEESGVPGEARTEDDNIPDDFKVGRTLYTTIALSEAAMLTGITVWRLSRRSHPPYPHAVHSQGLRHPHSPAAVHDRSERCQLLL